MLADAGQTLCSSVFTVIDQFHVLRYCFLNDALCLCGSYDCT